MVTPAPQRYNLLFGNIAFIFAFGYFSTYSSKVIRALDRGQLETGIFVCVCIVCVAAA